jgi:acetoin utilization deacetylase AcuC-like enzyme
MGFCLFNNVAVAAAHALEVHGMERVAILDWDVHHGNGTEAIFYEDPRVLYTSIHQSPLYPGTGAAGDTGAGEGTGFTINLPVPAGTGSEEFTSLVQHVFAPVVRDWAPGLIAISAGYDAHVADPLASCRVDEAGYGAMAASIRRLAVELEVPVLVCLEGGYAPDALGRSVVATLDGLSGDAAPDDAQAGFASPYRERLAERWPVLAP